MSTPNLDELLARVQPATRFDFFRPIAQSFAEELKAECPDAGKLEALIGSLSVHQQALQGPGSIARDLRGIEQIMAQNLAEIRRLAQPLPQNRRTEEILLYDVIGEDFWGEGLTAKGFAEQLQELDLREGDELVLRVNSPGGSVFDGLAIYNTLLAYPARKIVRVEGVALSAASFIIQAADTIEVAEASFVMIHRAWGIAFGDADDFMKTAAQLEQDDGVLAGIYAKRSGRPADEFRELMAEETWFTGAEAVEAKLADRLIETEDETETETEDEAEEAAAKWDARILDRFKHAPAALKDRSPSVESQWFAEVARRVAAVRAEGKVLSATNRSRLNEIRDLAQKVLDSDRKSDDDEENKARAKRQAETLTLMQMEIDLALAGTEAS